MSMELGLDILSKVLGLNLVNLKNMVEKEDSTKSYHISQCILVISEASRCFAPILWLKEIIISNDNLK